MRSVGDNSGAARLREAAAQRKSAHATTVLERASPVRTSTTTGAIVMRSFRCRSRRCIHCSSVLPISRRRMQSRWPCDRICSRPTAWRARASLPDNNGMRRTAGRPCNGSRSTVCASMARTRWRRPLRSAGSRRIWRCIARPANSSKSTMSRRTAAAGGGEYPLQDGFGWTNGVLRRLLADYPALFNDRTLATRMRSLPLSVHFSASSL